MARRKAKLVRPMTGELNSATAVNYSAGTSLVGPFWNFFRWIFGAPTISHQQATEFQTRQDYILAATQEQSKSSSNKRSWWYRPIDAVEIDTLPALDNFLDQFDVYFYRHQDKVLVVPNAFQCQDLDSREIQWSGPHDDEGKTTLDRLPDLIKVYEHLASSSKPWHRGIVRYVARHEAGFVLERLLPGPLSLVCPPAKTHDVFLALYQRWALQIISALDHLHSHGVMLNFLNQSGIWYREDLSIAIANLVNVGCAELHITAGSATSWESLESQWSCSQLYKDRSVDCTFPGVPRGDIFDWAAMVYKWMTGGEDLIGPDDMDSDQRQKAEQSIEKGNYSDWPQLSEEQLGPILIRAWNGDYDSAAEVLRDVKVTLEASRRTVDDDDVVGIEWKEKLEIMSLRDGQEHLRLRK